MKQRSTERSGVNVMLLHYFYFLLLFLLVANCSAELYQLCIDKIVVNT